MSKPRPRFWKSSGIHLTSVDGDGWLKPTADYIRAYMARPEVQPVADSCDKELALFDALMGDPFRLVTAADIDAMADADARDAYRIILTFRDQLVAAGTLEGAYLSMVTSGDFRLPPLFLDQMVHVILAHLLRDCDDPMRIKAAELFFRDQTVNIDDGRLMLADDEIVEMHAKTGGMGGLGQLLAQANTPMREVSLDVIDDDNVASYWTRADRFDMVMDFRFTQPAQDAFARVVEAWIGHFLNLDVRVQPMQSIRDERWSWHIGLDAEANRILNALYTGDEIAFADTERLVALFVMDIRDRNAVIDTMRGKPVYLGLAMTPGRKLKMKPQNLIINMPLKAS